jgi:hypothetical protein
VAKDVGADEPADSGYQDFHEPSSLIAIVCPPFGHPFCPCL